MAYRMSREENVFLAKRNVVDSIYRESRLEGINVTFPQTQEIYDNRSVAGLSVDEIIVINNLKHAWHFLLDSLDARLDLGYVEKMHSIVGEGLVLDAGLLRRGDVGIGGTSWRPPVPSRESALSLIGDVLALEPSPERAVEMYMRLAKAQLFWDGNKRTAQLIANKMLIEDGFGVLSVPVDRIQRFNELSIAYYDGADPTGLEAFLLEECIEGIDAR